MHVMRESWTDERLDDLNGKVDRGFNRIEAEVHDSRAEAKAEFGKVRAEMKEEFTAVRAEMKEEFTAVRAEMKEEFSAVRAEIKGEFTAVRAEMKDESKTMRAEIAVLRSDVLGGINALQRMMIQFSGVMVAALIGLVATQL